MLLSVCIPTYNRPDDLVNCLSSLAKQKNKKDFEICISDNNSAKKIINIILHSDLSDSLKKNLIINLIDLTLAADHAASHFLDIYQNFVHHIM